MSEDRLRAKQEKLQLEVKKMNDPDEGSQADEDRSIENRQLEGANQEWRRFYEVIKGITNDMRY